MTEMAVSGEISTAMLPTRLDSANASSIEAALLSQVRPNGRLIIDGSEVVYMSAAGVRTLATVLHKAEELQARIVFCRFSGPAADCLLVSGFSELLDVAESVAEASRRLSAEPTFRRSDDRLHPRADAG